MKVAKTLPVFMMLIMGTIARPTKQLKTPRIYNAFVTSDEKLLPSQAYPAITPVIQYPIIAAPSLYPPLLAAPMFNAGATAGGRSFSYAVKQDYFTYNYFENDAAQPANYPESNQPPIYTGGSLQPVPKAQSPYTSSDSRSDTKKNYDSKDEPEEGEDDSNHDDYADTNTPVVPSKGQLPRGHNKFRKPSRGRNQKRPHSGYPQRGNFNDKNADSVDDEANEQGVDDENESHDGGSYLPVSPFIKNNQSKDPNIVDIPPEPLPIGKSRARKKKPEEYPPSPAGYFL